MSLLTRLFDVLSVAVTALVALLIVSLGFFMTDLLLTGGWVVFMGFIAIITVSAIVETTVISALLAPFQMGRLVWSRFLAGDRVSAREVTADNEAASRFITHCVLGLALIGALLAMLSYVIGGFI